MTFPSLSNSEREIDLTLTGIIAPTPVSTFIAQDFGQSLRHWRGSVGRFREIFGWGDLAEYLEKCAPNHDHFRVVRNGKRLADELYLTRAGFLNAGALTALLSRGATLILDFVDQIFPKLQTLPNSVSAAFPSKTWINLYASWGNEPGLDLHADSHDVFILQIAGKKDWSIYRPVRFDPNDSDIFEPPAPGAKPEWTGKLDDGDVLYIPRGWPHSAVAKDGPSLHLTLAVARPTGSEYLTVAN